MTAGGDRGDNTARCPVGRVVYGDRECDGPGTYYCDSDLWGSACRRYFESAPTLKTTPVPAADRQTDEERCEQCEGSGVVACWNPGGPCPIPNDPACDTCGPCNQCPAHADAVMADLGAAITEGVTAARLRDAVAQALAASDPVHMSAMRHYVTMADAVLGLPEMRALLDARQAELRAWALADRWMREGNAPAAIQLRAALRGEP